MVFDSLTVSGAQLEHLDVSAAEMCPAGVRALIGWLNGTPQERLKHINVGTNKLGDEGLVLLVEALAANDGLACPHLESLKVDEVGLTTEGFKSLSFNRIPSLQLLSVLGNDHDDVPTDVLVRLQDLYTVVIFHDEDDNEDV